MFLAAVLTISLVLSSCSTFVSGKLQNITVDDTLGDPVLGLQITYSPSDLWSYGPNCTDCAAHPEAELAYDGTWHDTTYNSSLSESPFNASLIFNGSAIYVYCIVFHTIADPNAQAYMRFAIDDEVVGTFELTPSGSGQVDYHYAVYKNETINPGVHTFTLMNGSPGGSTSLALLDYVIYSMEVADDVNEPSGVETSTTLPSAPIANHTVWVTTDGISATTSRTIIIAVSTVGGVLLLTAMILVFLWARRRHRIVEREGTVRWAKDLTGQGPSLRSSRTFFRALFPSTDSIRSQWQDREGTVKSNVSTLLEKPRNCDIPEILQVQSLQDSPNIKNLSGEDHRSTHMEVKTLLPTPPPRLVVKIPQRLPTPAISDRDIKGMYALTQPAPPPTPVLPVSRVSCPLNHVPPVPPLPPNIRPRSTVTLSTRTPSSGPETSRTSAALTYISIATTPTSVVPSGYFIPQPETPDMPARADSVKTIKDRSTRRPGARSRSRAVSTVDGPSGGRDYPALQPEVGPEQLPQPAKPLTTEERDPPSYTQTYVRPESLAVDDAMSLYSQP
ncbi:uncharacterized protein FIBRA_03346 [Fibroporia radiculosa]|uniref:Uncharacterized protein n=1 Tax=Fibroporia radiculosa TaxID=599839 RepID=J4HVY0_9APHY|nr:uncharacterized protein FIBRA_03346 [Fibroporia radiculosa]CCM01297.1 predicted protein [Fibroporia radiculosa]